VAKDTATAKKPIKVCMHVLRDACNDVRAIRAGTTLIQEGFDVSIIDVQHDRSRPSKEDVQGMHMNHLLIPGWYTSRRSQLWFFIIALRTFILSIVRLVQSRADIYHASELTALPACGIVAALRHKPLVYEAYELPIPYPETSVAFWRKSAKFLNHFLAFVLPCCAGVIATSPFHAWEMQKHFHLKEICLLRNIPPYKVVQKSERLRRQLGLNPDIHIALYQGNIQSDRGLDKLVRAAKFLEQNNVIVMMGKGPKEMLSELESLIVNEEVTDRIKILPPVPYEELLAWTASADIGLTVLPPDYSLRIQLCLPNKLFEYLMAGVPVLATQLDAVQEIIQTYDVGRIVPSAEPKDIGAAINAMLADREALARMSRNALEAAERDLRWEKESNELISLYQKILYSR
jgi:glycosyltransferase involved in cell wall biosynthesis